ncbi:MAG TPA: TCR/Tet family MFS transporter [Afifellaceae bacterium]|nr:TCR/Tet family MFS transporter [Afifellaceae bacterium]
MAISDSAATPVRKNAVLFVFVTVLLDAIGIGIIIPVMPDLLTELSDLPLSDAAYWGGYLAFTYALMQFLCSPTVGNLSDRFGRRPVLLASLAALCIDYVVMGLAQTLWLLFLTRIVAGIAGSTYSTANAYVADVTPAEKRAQNFGLMGAGFGLGFVFGPVIGGLAGEYGTRIPFFAAAALAGLNVAYGLFVLPESLKPEKRRGFSWARANPLGVARRIAAVPMLAWFFVAVFLFDLAHFVYPAVWSFYTKEAFAWSSAEIGLSLAVVGIGFAIVQGWLIRRILPALGETRTAIAGFAINAVGMALIAFASAGWMIYALMPLTALGAIVPPALTGTMSNRIPDDAQGELQGAMSSIAGITMIITPLVMTQLFGQFTARDGLPYFPGAPFLAAALLMAAAIPPFVLGLRTPRKA